jgi:hypothetical protein
MNKLLKYYFFGILFFSSLSQARSCRDEPERCPVRVMSCVYQSSVKKLNVFVYSSLFSGYSVQVYESRCVDRDCSEQKLNGNFRVSIQNGGYVLASGGTGATYSLHCTKTENGEGL